MLLSVPLYMCKLQALHYSHLTVAFLFHLQLPNIRRTTLVIDLILDQLLSKQNLKAIRWRLINTPYNVRVADHIHFIDYLTFILHLQMVIVGDVCALPPPRGIAGRRGLAGTVLVHKVFYCCYCILYPRFCSQASSQLLACGMLHSFTQQS